MPYCDRCDRYFSSWSALDQHIRDSSFHYVCHDCDKDFPTWLGLKEHYVQSPRHHYCQSCNSHFSSGQDLIDHYYDDHDYCGSCDRVFKNAIGLHEHNRQCHHYCIPCKRVFNSESNLRTHERSSLHQPKNVECFFRCGQLFVSQSAMILHLESGTCKSGVTRRAVDQYVRWRDRNNLITDPSRLITSGDHQIGWVATERTWNGSAYECVLCHALFRSLRDLNQHMASPRHQQKIYRCPLSSCRTNFNTLSGLCQHVESEKCGVRRFRAVQDAMDSLLGGMNRLKL